MKKVGFKLVRDNKGRQINFARIIYRPITRNYSTLHRGNVPLYL